MVDVTENTDHYCNITNFFYNWSFFMTCSSEHCQASVKLPPFTQTAWSCCSDLNSFHFHLLRFSPAAPTVICLLLCFQPIFGVFWIIVNTVVLPTSKKFIVKISFPESGGRGGMGTNKPERMELHGSQCQCLLLTSRPYIQILPVSFFFSDSLSCFPTDSFSLLPQGFWGLCRIGSAWLKMLTNCMWSCILDN